MFKTLSVLFTLVIISSSLFAKGPSYDDPAKAKADVSFDIQGEYSGRVGDDQIKLGVQVIALGEGKFQTVAYLGGLPGDGWNGEKPDRLESEIKDGIVTVSREDVRATIKDGVLTIYRDDEKVGQLNKVSRKSPTLGKKPSADAIVLFDGKNVDAWEKGRITKDGLLMQGTRSKQKFQSQQFHIEFRLPFQPQNRSQGRGNSGLYLQGRYEVQMLDSFGLEGKDNECGGIYSIKDPDLNMCFPPLTWQTYDVDFTAAKYDDDGKLISNPRITVRHNGVIIHKNVELPKSTTAAPLKPGKTPGPIYLQDHGHPIRYRNIWAVEK